jgi:hypothetical protein
MTQTNMRRLILYESARIAGHGRTRRKELIALQKSTEGFHMNSILETRRPLRRAH